MTLYVEYLKIPKEISITYKKKELELSTYKASITFSISKSIDLRITEFKNLEFRLSLSNLKKKSFKKRFLRSQLPVLYTCKHKILQGLFGLTVGFYKQVVLEGVGYKAELLGFNILSLKLGYSHEIIINVPNQINVSISKETVLLLKSFSIEALCNFVSLLESYKFPDIYKNKGVIIVGRSLNKKKIKKK